MRTTQGESPGWGIHCKDGGTSKVEVNEEPEINSSISRKRRWYFSDTKKVKKKRANWGKGRNLVILIKAAHDWYKNTGDAMDINNEKIWLGNL